MILKDAPQRQLLRLSEAHQNLPKGTIGYTADIHMYRYFVIVANALLGVCGDTKIELLDPKMNFLHN